MRWADAVAAAAELRRRCASLGEVAGRRVIDGAAGARENDDWALVLHGYAIHDQPLAGGLDLARLRVVAGQDDDAFAGWLWEQLSSAGYPVERPDDPATARPGAGLAAELQQLRELAVQETAPQADDPPVVRWRTLSRLVSTTMDFSDGLEFTPPPTRELNRVRAQMARLLDELLVRERGGWSVATPVRATGIPALPWLRRGTPTATASPDRALIDRPRWDVDAGTLRPGPPRAYWVRPRDAIVPSAGDVLVPVENLRADPAPWPDQDDDIGWSTARHHVLAEHRHIEAPILLPAQAQLGIDAPPAVAWRRASLERLWRLRDRELRHCGDSTPRRRAERRVAGERPHLPTPPSSDTLDALDRLAELRASGELISSQADHPAITREMVTGRRRDILADWLADVTDSPYTTARQRQVLDGIPADVEGVVAWLRAEGFLAVGEHHQPQHQAGVSGITENNLLFAHVELGLLADVALTGVGDDRRPTRIRVRGNVEVLDTVVERCLGAGGYLRDGQGRMSAVSLVGVSRGLGTSFGGSLRAALAAMRVFTAPVLPWQAPVRIRFGTVDDSEATRQTLRRLPGDIRDLFGPELLAGADATEAAT